MLAFKGEGQYIKPHFWSLMCVHQDDGFGNFQFTCDSTWVFVFIFLYEDLH